jgi:hypothetical protein
MNATAIMIGVHVSTGIQISQFLVCRSSGDRPNNHCLDDQNRREAPHKHQINDMCSMVHLEVAQLVARAVIYALED